MSMKAVNIVLLPDEAAMEVAIRANAELVSRFGEEIILNKTDCLPHISLAMGCVDDANISTIKGILQKIAAGHCLWRLRVIGVYTSVDSEGEKVSVFVVEKTTELQRLHEEIMASLEPYLSSEVSSCTV
jgi:2'-5' RNA ligase